MSVELHPVDARREFLAKNYSAFRYKTLASPHLCHFFQDVN